MIMSLFGFDSGPFVFIVSGEILEGGEICLLTLDTFSTLNGIET
jgi:hypothetical protein